MHTNVDGSNLHRSRITDDAVGHAVRRVTRCERPAIEHAQCGWRQLACRICEDGERRVEVARHQSRPVVRRHSGDDAVVVGGEPLRRHQTFVPARRAPDEIRALGRFAVEGLHERLGLHRRLVVGSVGKVDQLFRFVERKFCGVRTRAGLMPGVGRRRRVAAPQLVGKRPEGNDPGPAAVADAGELSVPVVERQPDLEDDLRLGRWRDDSRDAAERREVANRRSSILPA